MPEHDVSLMNDKQKVENQRWQDQNQPLEFWHIQSLKRIKKGKVLDVGCGDGLLQVELAARGITDTMGVDVSETGIEKAKAKGLNVVLGDTTDLSSVKELQGLTFDAITILEVLEHVFNPDNILKGARERIAKDGDLYASTPNFNAIGDRLRVLRGTIPWQKKPHKGHVYWMNKSIFTKLIEDAGFRVVELESLGYRRGKSFESLFSMLAKWWPSLFALSFFVHAKPKA